MRMDRNTAAVNIERMHVVGTPCGAAAGQDNMKETNMLTTTCRTQDVCTHAAAAALPWHGPHPHAHTKRGYVVVATLAARTRSINNMGLCLMTDVPSSYPARA